MFIQATAIQKAFYLN